jgi:N-acetylated-alpha-linked acidic dipeptidase
MWGFTAENAAQERAREEQFDSGVNRENLRAWMQRMSSAPNHVGSRHDDENAQFILGLYRSWGWQAHIETFEVLFPTPKLRVLELLGPKPFRAALVEPPIPGDPSTARQKDALPPYNAYSADGDVTAPLVYVNTGLPEDYEELRRRGISVRGRIVLARYKGSWRGIKPKLAQHYGAVGCILYSDPEEDDGYAHDDPYPKGPGRPALGVQRGSVMDVPVFSGDPLTPGIGATEGAPRLSRDESPVLLKIPVIPISYQDAQPLLRALAGPVTPEKWRGALPLTYHFGPSASPVHLRLEFDWRLRPIHDVIATIPGEQYPDQWVVRGNHFDAWVFGASDPLSGQVALLEEARGIAGLMSRGWRPKRTIVYASWDGEEPGLLGSTEWAEAHAEELKRKMVLYVNSDNVQRGFLRVGASQSLQRFLNEVAGDVVDPETGATVGERLRARRALAQFEASSAESSRDPDGAPKRDLVIDALGSGSDYTPFLQHLGIASVDLAYNGEGGARGVYHSAYDTYTFYTRFADPQYEYVATLAKTAARTVLRFADADILPVHAEDLAQSLQRYVKEIKATLKKMGETAAVQARLTASDAYGLTSDPNAPMLAPRLEPAPPAIDFGPMDSALERLEQSASAFDRAVARATEANSTVSREEVQAANAKLQGLEQTVLFEEGLPGRSWYQNLLYAPGLYTGYGVKTLPGIREAIENRDWSTATRYIERTQAALENYASRLDEVAAQLH